MLYKIDYWRHCYYATRTSDGREEIILNKYFFPIGGQDPFCFKLVGRATLDQKLDKTTLRVRIVPNNKMLIKYKNKFYVLESGKSYGFIDEVFFNKCLINYWQT